MNTQSQNLRILKALRAGRRLTSVLITQLTGSTAPATRLSATRRQYNLDLNKVWIKRNGKRYLQWSLIRSQQPHGTGMRTCYP